MRSPELVMLMSLPDDVISRYPRIAIVLARSVCLMLSCVGSLCVPRMSVVRVLYTEPVASGHTPSLWAPTSWGTDLP
eukprot:3936000-Rhodomonas_salina.1